MKAIPRQAGKSLLNIGSFSTDIPLEFKSILINIITEMNRPTNNPKTNVLEGGNLASVGYPLSSYLIVFFLSLLSVLANLLVNLLSPPIYNLN